MFENIKEVLEDYCGVILPVESVEVIFKNSYILSEIEAYGTHDTQVREQICDVLTSYFGMVPWPRYGDNDKYKDLFYSELIAKVKAFGGHCDFQ